MMKYAQNWMICLTLAGYGQSPETQGQSDSHKFTNHYRKWSSDKPLMSKNYALLAPANNFRYSRTSTQVSWTAEADDQASVLVSHSCSTSSLIVLVAYADRKFEDNELKKRHGQVLICLSVHDSCFPLLSVERVAAKHSIYFPRANIYFPLEDSSDDFRIANVKMAAYVM